VDYVERAGTRPVFTAVVVERAAVHGARKAILRLAERLEGSRALSARGVVLARALLIDGRGPLFNRHSERTVSEAISDVEEALGAGGADALSI
jgi:hypothetical protein